MILNNYVALIVFAPLDNLKKFLIRVKLRNLNSNIVMEYIRRNIFSNIREKQT